MKKEKPLPKGSVQMWKPDFKVMNPDFINILNNTKATAHAVWEHIYCPNFVFLLFINQTNRWYVCLQ